MAQPTNTLDAYDISTTTREQILDIIYNIDPTETPFVTGASRGNSTNILKEWTIDDLATAADVKGVEGRDFAGDALSPPNKLGNYHQITYKDIVVSGRAEIVNKVGRKSEIAYEISKGMKEIKRNMETTALTRKIAVVGTASTPGETAGVPAWIRSNQQRGTNGTAPALSATNNGFPSAVGTAGTLRGLAESHVRTGVLQAYEAGGNPTCLLMAPRLKQSFSGFLFSNDSARVAEPRQDYGKAPMKGATVLGAVDVYKSDFATLECKPDRFLPVGTGNRTEVFILDEKYWEISHLRGLRVLPIAKTGDNIKRMLLVDWTVVSRNEKASAIIADINNNTAVAA